MTFSHDKVVAHASKHFVPVWESVSPVSVAVFDLGGGKEVRGTMSGEIALYFCRPDGTVFDILPALHSPEVTYRAMVAAFDFYQRTGATDEAIREHHTKKLTAMIVKGEGDVTPAMAREKRRLTIKRHSSDGGTRALGEMAFSKTVMPFPETMTVVEPGGLAVYRKRTHQALSTASPQTPQQWKKYVFETILEEELKGGEFRYDVDSLAPISLPDD